VYLFDIDRPDTLFCPSKRQISQILKQFNHPRFQNMSNFVDL